jgi:hypothetical protein
MEIKKYKKKFILFLSYTVFMILFLITSVAVGAMVPGPSITTFIPVNNSTLEACIMIFIFWPLSAILGIFIGKYIVLPLYLFFHKKFVGLNMEYGIQDKKRPEKLKRTFAALIPALLAINLALILAQIEGIALLVAKPAGTMLQFNAFIILLMFTIIIAMALYSPVWFFLDSGLVYSNKEKVEDRADPIEVKSVGGWYRTILKGYAGISVIITFIQFLLMSVWAPDPTAFLFNLIGVSLFPFFISLTSLLALIIVDMSAESNIKYVRKLAEKNNISDYMEVKIEKIRKQ